MSHEADIHQTQIVILRELLFRPEASFADLQKASKLESDHVKFHINRLVGLKYVTKVAAGKYRLSTRGKEYANKLDTDTNTIERQPKVSVALILQRQKNGTTEYLCQQRLKNPFFGFWGRFGGKVRWGETFEEAATRELKEETGLDGKFEFQFILRKRDFSKEDRRLLEDKIFVVMFATAFSGKLIERYEGGYNKWMTQKELGSQEKYFESAYEFINMAGTGQPYIQKDYEYSLKEY